MAFEHIATSNNAHCETASAPSLLVVIANSWEWFFYKGVLYVRFFAKYVALLGSLVVRPVRLAAVFGEHSLCAVDLRLRVLSDQY